MKNYYIGIDCGINGAIAVLDQDYDIVQVFDMPTMETKVGKTIKRRVHPFGIVAELNLFRGDRVFAMIEQVNAMPNQGVTSMFSFGRSLGVVEGVLSGMAFPYDLVTSGVWKKAMGVNASKDGARELAMRTWPKHAELFKRKKDDGRAEAALIALYLYEAKK